MHLWDLGHMIYTHDQNEVELIENVVNTGK